ncbi:MAG: FMN-binding glutamate synthase family protein [bacterium]|nr:FMN-binding glutamate synthase family protein [bacterium]
MDTLINRVSNIKIEVHMVRYWFYIISIVFLAAIGFISTIWIHVLWSLAIIVPLVIIGLNDIVQKKHAILRNFPVIGHLRYMFEMIRPEIQQYFIDSNIDAFPIEREFRDLVYQRAKGTLETKPFGTHRDVYKVGYEWATQSINPVKPLNEEPKVLIGGLDCKKPYLSSLLNISAMSFGALSKNAVLALNKGAKEGNFAHNTGEGGLSPYHLEPGGDIIWQIGTGYFGCRTKEGKFDPEKFATQASLPNVKMIELKISQGAKPGHGGVLPGCKVTQEIANIRGVAVGKTVISPPGHCEFSTPIELLEFLKKLRELSGSKPVGFKICIGQKIDFFAICKAMINTGIIPDFITVDGGEGGTGAAPLEFTNSVGMPGKDALIFVHSTLVGVGLRDRIRIISSGKILTGFHMIRALSIGADICASARGMMLALGCIQALRCNSDHCPTGIATQNPALAKGLDITDKGVRVARFHLATIEGFLELLGALGLSKTEDLSPRHIFRRIDDIHISDLSKLCVFLKPGQLLNEETVPDNIKDEWQRANPDKWLHN